MTGALRSYPSRGVLDRPRSRWADVAVFVGAAIVIWLIVRVSAGMHVPFDKNAAPATISTDPAELPYYAARSLARMMVALGCSIVFTFVFATAAARLPRADKVLLPLLDILQSVPILGFLSVTITGFIALFPGSSLGLECASIFAIFTSQAWNMAFAFHHSLVSQPRELDEASRNLRLSRWQRFWRIDVPSGMFPLVWNAMMSFGGGWFFLSASEAISVNNRQYVLPGIGSYVAVASAESDTAKVVLAIVVMVVMVVGLNIVFWRPITVWAERFRMEDTESADAPRSRMLDLLRRSHVPGLLGRVFGPLVYPIDRFMRIFGLAEHPLYVAPARRRAADVVFAIVVGAGLIAGTVAILDYIDHTVGFGEVAHALGLGLITLVRVIVLLIFATAVWVPVGVWIGLNPRVSRLAQPIVQVLASFPANFLFPLVTAVLVATGASLQWAAILLMALGAQWYILFNVIAGAAAVPNDLREAAANLRLSRRLWWRKLILPAIFPSFVTGAITAAGGAWNASIVAEIVRFGDTTLTATGLGAYIAEATRAGDWPRILVGVLAMSAFVVGINRLFWRRLYGLAQRRYSL
ncbi:ABC transporter permease [Nocardia seriolae]|uniref:Sulfonate ABC transporter permease n=1 Tax=Nocardia seriolae TaxID=37332 RepID=A0ABC9YVY8_9NOCA|nr:ABC transporter permease subunit [Nocardia seriolae]BEK95708.1 ABC transporter permease subunit [Nocardia seriolae]GAM47305.1 sulfonate ABC transporter permease [Nocardia seriolae]GAP29213.1 sulfonate ABC transporter permease [Nocardia seriolae]